MRANILTTTTIILVMVLGTVTFGYANDKQKNDFNELYESLLLTFAKEEVQHEVLNQQKSVEVYDLDGNLIYVTTADLKTKPQNELLYHKYISNGVYLLELNGVEIYLASGNL